MPHQKARICRSDQQRIIHATHVPCSVVQMPKGVPVATVAIGGAENAALLAIQMMSIKYTQLREGFKEHKKKMEEEIMAIDKEFTGRK